MKTQPLQLILTVLNVALLVATALLTLSNSSKAEEVTPMLRGRGLQIVDGQGHVRASIQILPASTQKNGEHVAETVLLRLITEKGRPVVKIASSEESAGLALVGPTGTKNTYVQLGVKGESSALTLKNEDGREKVVKP
jgi:hypothetical protein